MPVPQPHGWGRGAPQIRVLAGLCVISVISEVPPPKVISLSLGCPQVPMCVREGRPAAESERGALASGVGGED